MCRLPGECQHLRASEKRRASEEDWEDERRVGKPGEGEFQKPGEETFQEGG